MKKVLYFVSGYEIKKEKKMSKLESAKKIIKQGNCNEICCPDCFLNERCPCKINAILQLAKEYIKENEMKVGDVVRWNGNTQDSNDLYMNFGMMDFLKGKKTHVISNITSSGNLKFKEDEIPYCFAPSWFEKVEEPIYEIGKRYIVADTEEELEVSEREYILVAYLPNTTYPFICVERSYENEYKNGEFYHIRSWKYAKPILEKKYKAYEEPKLEWIGKYIKRKSDGLIFVITSICKEKTIRISDTSGELGKRFTMQEFLDEFSWLYDSICGEEI